jgi:hypothetical protein
VDRRCLADRLHPHRVRPLTSDREALQPGRVGRLRLLRQPLPLLLGLRLHLVATPTGLPITFALSNPKIDEREVAIDLFDADPALLAGRAGQTLIADKGYASAEFEACLAHHGIELLRPARRDERPRRGAPSSRPCARSSNRSTPPSRPSSASNATAATATKASWSGSCKAFSRSPPPSGTTTTPTSPSSDPSPPTTTDPLDFHV